MIHVALPDGLSRRSLPFYLAMEEWVADALPEGEYFFAWNVGPTVICGRHQDIPVEVDLAYCRELGIEVTRRKSGGGCVYADYDNLMLSYVSTDTDVQRAFGRYTAIVVEALRLLGVDARASGRNDVLIDGRKVSGGAFLRLSGRSIAHSTMLVSTDFGNMLRAITPDRSKLLAHKVKSVESRITTLNEYLPSLTVEDLASHLVEVLTDETVRLSMSQVSEIEAIERGYHNPEWLRLGGDLQDYGRRLDGVGSVKPAVACRDGKIESLRLEGDFLHTADPTAILERCVGMTLEEQGLEKALEGIGGAIPGLAPKELAQLIIEETKSKI